MEKNTKKAEVKSKHITASELNSEAFSFDEQMLYKPSSKLTTFKHWWNDVAANIYKWYIAHPLTFYTIKRIIYGLLTLLIAIIVIALLVHNQINPEQFLPENIDQLHLSAAQREALKLARMKEFGFSTNIWVFLGNYLYNLMPFIPKWTLIYQEWGLDASGNLYIVSEARQLSLGYLGVATSQSLAAPGTPVMDIFGKAIPYSFGFGALAVTLSYLIGVPLGIESAKRKGKTADSLINGANVLIIAVPPVVIVMGIYILAVVGIGTSSMFATGSFWSKFWPLISLILMFMPANIVYTRRYVIDEMTADYTKFAFSQGFSTNRVFYLHIFRNAGIRIIKTFPVELLATLFGSSMLVEKQWGIPGMSQFIVGAAGGAPDPYIILGFVSFTAFVQVFSSLLSDLVVVWMDPRVSLGKK